MLMSLTVHLFSRIRYYYPHFTEKEAKTQQEYMDARKKKNNKTKNLDTSSPSVTGQFRFSHYITG